MLPTPLPRPAPEYLGDAVYAIYNGDAIELRLNDHREPAVVFLDSQVAEALVRYIQKVNEYRNSR